MSTSSSLSERRLSCLILPLYQYPFVLSTLLVLAPIFLLRLRLLYFSLYLSLIVSLSLVCDCLSDYRPLSLPSESIRSRSPSSHFHCPCVPLVLGRLWVFYFNLFALKKVTSFLTHPSFSSFFPFVLKERMFPSFLLSFLMSLPLSCLRSFLLISRLIFYFFTTILHSSPRLWTLNDQSVHSCHDSSISTALSLSFYSSLSHSHTLVKFCMDFSKGVHEVSFHLNVSCFKSPFKDSMTINVEFDFDHVWPHTPGLYGQSLDEKVEKRRKEDFLVINGHRVAAFVPFSLDPCVPSVVQRGWSYNRRHMWWRKTTRSLNSHRCDCSFSTF